jgi:hypothetical protein
MKTTSVLFLLDDKTKKLYTFAAKTSRHQGTEQERNAASRPTPCYVVTGAIHQWTYFLLITLSS